MLQITLWEFGYGSPQETQRDTAAANVRRAVLNSFYRAPKRAEVHSFSVLQGSNSVKQRISIDAATLRRNLFIHLEIKFMFRF